MGLSQMETNVFREQLALQMQIYALNNSGTVSDSALSPSSAPFPQPQENPQTFMTSNAFGRRGGIAESQASTRSSPSHQQILSPPFSRGYRGRRRRERYQDLRRQSKTHPPPHVESTQPQDLSAEMLSGGKTPGESEDSELQHSEHRQTRWDEDADDENSHENENEADEDDRKWIDEDVGIEGVADDLLHHPDYVSDPNKRRRRWDLLWEALLRDVSAPVAFAL